MLAALLCSTAGAETLKGVALAIGQSDYEALPDLGNTGRDAKGIEDLLDRLGFETDAAVDRDARQLSRDLEGFAEDAEGADVAVLYYAGHAVEIGGLNYLLPTDIDAASPEAFASGLVSFADTVEALRRKAKLVIVLLDACRDNPLPPGTTVRLSPDGEPQAVTMVGAGTRGGTVLSRQADPATGNLGMVIGFAAEPGKVALDGEPGGNSPYAAALLRHIPAMAGAEFGQVMRMVTQEVYLKTNGRQRPWVNESLQQLLYFGEAASDPDGDEGDILKERRQLLLTIAALDAPRREQVERIAAEGVVPMDAIYGMLRAMGSDVPEDPAELDAVLKAQAERLKAILADRATLASPDTEIVRLSTLADKALADGALDANLKFREAAKARFSFLQQTLDAAEEELSAQRLDGGAVLARTAEAHELMGDYAAAADNYAQAFAQVERWDRRTAWRYKVDEANALQTFGEHRGDNEALMRSIAAYDLALTLAPRGTARDDWAATQNDLGIALQTLGERENGPERLEQAIEAYRAALQEYTRERAPLDWAMTQNNLGNALQTLGERESGPERLEQAIEAYRAALQEYTRGRAPLDWAMTQTNLGNALVILGQSETDTAPLEQAVEAYRAALEERTRERVPLDWAMTQTNLGSALVILGQRESGTAWLEQAVEAYHAALQELTRERMPIQWAGVQNNLGIALWTLGERESGTARLNEAVMAYRVALEEWTRERMPLQWATTQTNLGSVLQTLGERESGTARLEEAVGAYRAALEGWTREDVPIQWARAQNGLGNALRTLGEREGGTERLKQAVEASRAALQEFTRERVPIQWAEAQTNLGNALAILGQRESGTARLDGAVEAYRAALEEWTRERVPLQWAATQANLGSALAILGQRESGTARLEEAIAAFYSALEEFTRERVPIQWAETQGSLGDALVELGKRSKRRSHIDHGREAIATAWAVYREAGYVQHDDDFRRRVDEADAALAALE